MAKKTPLVDLTTGEIQDEINARADFRADELIKQRTFFRHPLSRHRTPAPSGGQSMTHQSHADSCDINNIIRQFDRTGSLPPSDKIPFYDDVSSLNRPLSELVTQSEEISRQYESDMSRLEKQKAKAKADAEAAAATPPSAPPPAPPTKPPVNPELD